jgi:hypothetical protein
MTLSEIAPPPVGVLPPARYHKALRRFWTAVAVVTFVLLVERGILSVIRPAASDKWGAWVILFYAVALYALFLSEGVSHSVTQLHKADREGLLEAIANNENLSNRQRANLPGFLLSIFDNFEGFLIGRQIISLSAVALLAVAIEKSPETRGDAMRAYAISAVRSIGGLLPTVPESIAQGVHTVALFSEHFVGDFVAAFLLSALFPCWLAQILPGLLASRASIRFFNFFGAISCARSAIYIGRSGAGLPGQFLYKLFGSKTGFDREEYIGAGDASTYVHQRTGVGEGVSSRVIVMTIGKDALVVSDSMTIDVLGAPASKIDQTLKVAMSHCNPNDVEVATTRLECPAGTSGVVKTKAALLSIADKKLPAQAVARELIIFAEVVLQDAIPRGKAEAEAIRVEFNYKAPPLSLDQDTSDQICFDVVKPTKSLEIRLVVEPDLFFEAPNVTVSGIEEVLRRGWDAEEVDELQIPSTANQGRERILTVKYPRLGARYALNLNVMPAQPQP